MRAFRATVLLFLTLFLTPSFLPSTSPRANVSLPGVRRQTPDVSGKWRWEGTEKKIDLVQKGTVLTGKVHGKNGSIREVEGKVLASGEVELYEYVPRSETDIPAQVWQAVLLETEHPKHAGFVPIKILLKYSAPESKLEGDRHVFDVEYIRSTAKFQALKTTPSNIRLIRVGGICGPDVTDQTLLVMYRIAQAFLATPAQQGPACKESVSFIDGFTYHGQIGPFPLITVDPNEMKADYAWDVIELFQNAGKFPKGSDPGAPSYWENLSGSSCCTPRYPCGKSVEFFGACHDQQVINYVMWGMMMSLCGNELTIEKQQAALAFLRNYFGPNWRDQQTMTDVGRRFASVMIPYLKDPKKFAALRQKYDSLRKRIDIGTAKQADMEAFYESIPAGELGFTLKLLSGFKTETEMTSARYWPELKTIVERGDAASSRPYKICDTVCAEKLTPAQASKIASVKLRFRWNPLIDEGKLKSP
jgi:hypothetical protein